MVNLLFNLSFQQNRKQISNSNVHYVMVSHGLMIGCINVSIFLQNLYFVLFCTVIYCVFAQDVELKVSEIIYDLVGQLSYMGRYFNVSLLTYIYSVHSQVY